jgi:serine/threonine-protein kinase
VPELETGRIIAGRYRLERALAQGAMGSVWVGRHLQLDVDIAIKFMAPQLASSPDLRARFEREAKAAALLKSPYAVQVYDYGIEDGTPYIVMELLEGEDLSARLAREGRLSIPAMYRILDEVGKALRRAHEIGLVHRDLKPGNIFLSRQAGEEIVKVVDFGIAKSTGVIPGAQATRTGALLGSPSYMSPEQIRSSNQVDHRTDLWSLGVIAFQCLTGRLPFPGDEVGEVLVDVCTAPIPVASQIAPGLPPAVDRFLERALMRPVDQRFQSAREMVEAFGALLGVASAAPVQAEPAPVVPAQAPRSMVVDTRPPASGPRSVAPTIGSGTEVAAPLALPPPAGGGTLSPASHTRPEPAPQPSSGGRTALVIGLGLGVVAIGSAAFFLLRAPAPVTPSPASAVPPTTATAAAPFVPSSTPSDPATAAPPVVTPVAPSAAAPEASSRSRPSGKSGGGASAPSKRSDDLLNHM